MLSGVMLRWKRFRAGENTDTCGESTWSGRGNGTRLAEDKHGAGLEVLGAVHIEHAPMNRALDLAAGIS